MIYRLNINPPGWSLFCCMNQHIGLVFRVRQYGAEGQVTAGDASVLDAGRVGGSQVAVCLEGCAWGGVVVEGKQALGLRGEVAALQHEGQVTHAVAQVDFQARMQTIPPIVAIHQHVHPHGAGIKRGALVEKGDKMPLHVFQKFPTDVGSQIVNDAFVAVEKVAKATEGMQIVKTILVKNRLVNLIVKPQ